LWEKIKGVVIMINCPNCKRLIKENVKFCPYCGFKIEGYLREEEKVCPQCGTPYKEGQNFCKICGYDLREKREYKTIDWKIPIIVVALIALIFAFLYFNGYILDNKPPVVEVSSKYANKEALLTDQKNELTIEIFIIAKDNRRLNKIELFLNDKLLKIFGGFSQITYTWIARNEGNYIFKVIACDNAGNKSELKTMNIKVLKISSPELSLIPEGLEYVGYSVAREGMITGEDVLLRRGPTITTEILDAMSKGDIVSVYGEAVSRKENEAIARYDTTMRTLNGGDYPINSGRALLIINDEDIYYLVEVEVGDGKLRGYILKEDAKKIYGDYWYYIRNKRGKIGWVYGGYVKINE
jgi:RNA polymerase subunit RPABC4/transcription elongation factor Spt4